MDQPYKALYEIVPFLEQSNGSRFIEEIFLPVEAIGPLATRPCFACSQILYTCCTEIRTIRLDCQHHIDHLKLSFTVHYKHSKENIWGVCRINSSLRILASYELKVIDAIAIDGKSVNTILPSMATQSKKLCSDFRKMPWRGNYRAKCIRGV